MAKAHIEFDLTNEDDCREHLCAVYAVDLAYFVWELKHNILRNAVKNDLDPYDIQKLIYEKIEDLGFDIDELVV